MRKGEDITVEQVREYFDYDPDTGVMRWKKKPCQNILAGKICGTPNSHGYLRVGFKGMSYPLHRLIWFYMTGTWPESVDHINGIVDDNSWSNLRSVSHDVNCKNRKTCKLNTSSCTGVHLNKKYKRWIAVITVNCEKIYLGCFKSFDDAVMARKQAEKKYGFHPNHGRT